MRHLLPMMLLLGVVALPACGKADASQGSQATEQLNSAADATAAAATQAANDQAAKKICCGGACDAPAGYCCSDGTCHGGHEELPVWEP